MGHSNRQLFQMNQRFRQGIGKQNGTDDGNKQPYDTAQCNEILHDDYRRFQWFQRLGNNNVTITVFVYRIDITDESHVIIPAVNVNFISFILA